MKSLRPGDKVYVNELTTSYTCVVAKERVPILSKIFKHSKTRSAKKIHPTNSFSFNLSQTFILIFQILIVWVTVVTIQCYSYSPEIGGKSATFFSKYKVPPGFGNIMIYVFQIRRWCQNDSWFHQCLLAARIALAQYLQNYWEDTQDWGSILDTWLVPIHCQNNDTCSMLRVGGFCHCHRAWTSSILGNGCALVKWNSMEANARTGWKWAIVRDPDYTRTVCLNLGNSLPLWLSPSVFVSSDGFTGSVPDP